MASLLSAIFPAIFGGTKQRSYKSTTVQEKPLTAQSGTIAAVGELISQSNEISKVTAEAQQQQNYLLVEILKSLDNIKEGGIGETVGNSILGALAELTAAVLPAIVGGTLTHFLDADESKAGNSIVGSWINENIPGAAKVDNFVYEKTGGLVGTSINDPRYSWNKDMPDALKNMSGKIIEFEAADINITAQEMLIRADEIVDNSDLAGGGDAVAEGGGGLGIGATPPSPGGGATPGGPQADISKINQSVSQLSEKVKGEFGDFRITSGFRDPIHNAAVGGARNSAHTRGNAIDVSFAGDIPTTLKFIQIASKAGAGGIGVYRPGLVHIDTESRRAWGPDYHFGSVPQWAMPAIQQHLSGGKQNVPAFASGVMNLKKSGPAITGELGSEAIINKSGKIRQSGKGPVLRNLQQGDNVIPASQTNAFGNMFSMLSSDSGSKQSSYNMKTPDTYSSVPGDRMPRSSDTYSSVPGDRMPRSSSSMNTNEPSTAAMLVPQIIRLASALNDVQQEPQNNYYQQPMSSGSGSRQYSESYYEESRSEAEPEINTMGNKPPSSSELLYLYNN